MTSRALIKEYKDGKLYLTGPMILSDTPNANGIVYPKHVVENMVEEYNKRQHPLYGTTEEVRSYKINLNDAVAKTNSLQLKEGHLEATVEILPSVYGKTLEKMVLENKTVNIGFNTIVMGTVDENTNLVKEDAVIVGFSLVPLEELE